MSDEPTKRDVEALAERIRRAFWQPDIGGRWVGIAAAVLTSDWYAERIAQARREGAAEAPIADEVTAINALREIRALLDETPAHPNDGLRTSIAAILRAATLRGDA